MHILCLTEHHMKLLEILQVILTLFKKLSIFPLQVNSYFHYCHFKQILTCSINKSDEFDLHMLLLKVFTMQGVGYSVLDSIAFEV
jgi:hypothetical protein